MVSATLGFLIFLFIVKGSLSDINPGGINNAQFESSAESSYNVNTGSSQSGSTDTGDVASECIPYECGGKIIHPTPSPIHVYTNESTSTNKGPITAEIAQTGDLNITNTGRKVAVYAVTDVGLRTTLTGGILEGKKYFAYEGRLIWNCDKCQPAASIVDQKSTPLEALIIYQNSEYKSFEVALKSGDRHALVILSFPVKVDEKCYSKPFDKLLEYTKYIEAVNSYKIIPVSTYAEWYAVLPKTEKSYAYDGSYTDTDTGVQYYTALVIRLPLTDETACISPGQFDKFNHFRNKEGKFYCNAQKTYPRCDREVFAVGPVTPKS